MGFALVCLLLPIYVFSKLHVGQVYSHVDVHRLVLLHCLWYMFSYRLLWLTVILLNYVRSSTSSTFSLLTNLNAINVFGFEKNVLLHFDFVRLVILLFDLSCKSACRLRKMCVCCDYPLVFLITSAILESLKEKTRGITVLNAVLKIAICLSSCKNIICSMFGLAAIQALAIYDLSSERLDLVVIDPIS